MILQALYDLAQDERLVEDPDYEVKPVAWIVRVGKNGELLGIQGTRYTPPAEGKKKLKPLVKSFKLPKEPLGRSGTKAPPCFFYGNAKYVFGLPVEKATFTKADGLEKSGWFLDLVRNCATSTGDEGAQAVASLLAHHRSQERFINLADVCPDCTQSDLFMFIYAPDVDVPVHLREKVREYWRAQRQPAVDSSNDSLRCLVTGQPAGEVGLFSLIKRVPGGTAMGAALVSFNKPAFESYGLANNENAPVSRQAAEACATALNRLVHPAYPKPSNPDESLPRRNYRLGDDTAVCYWARGRSGEDFINALEPLLEANPDEVGALYQSIWRGVAPRMDDPSAFYALTITGTQGRAILRDWFESTVEKVAGNLTQHFSDLAIVRNTPKPRDRALPPQIPMHVLIQSLAVRGERKEVPSHLASDMVHAALSGQPYPIAVLQKALERWRAEIGRTEWLDLERRDARAALIKAVLNRQRRARPHLQQNFKEVTEQMDPHNTNPGYLLGRLMAVMERMQQAALGDINASVIDRFFAGASATPRAVFPRLMKNLRHHARKAKDEDSTRKTARWLEGQVDAIMAQIVGFPPHLDLEQQGLFVLGYHHQRHELWSPKQKQTEEKTDAVAVEA